MVRSNEDVRKQNEYNKAIKLGMGIGAVGVGSMAYKDSKNILNAIRKEDNANKKAKRIKEANGIGFEGRNGSTIRSGNFSSSKQSTVDKVKNGFNLDNIKNNLNEAKNTILYGNKDTREAKFVSAMSDLINKQVDENRPEAIKNIASSSHRVNNVRNAPHMRKLEKSKFKNGIDLKDISQQLDIDKAMSDTIDMTRKSDVARTILKNDLIVNTLKKL